MSDQNPRPVKVQNNGQVKDNKASDREKLECPICFESLFSKPVKATICGHLFCVECLEGLAAKAIGLCPICKTPFNIIKEYVGVCNFKVPI